VTVMFDHDVIECVLAARFTARLIELVQDGFDRVGSVRYTRAD